MRQPLFLFLLASATQTNAQKAVAVSKEPLHKNVFENKYLRVLDVKILPGDSTLFTNMKRPQFLFHCIR
jgi:hypothetical protein